jgi:hypothetical protein
LPEYLFCPLSTLAVFLLHVTEKAGELLVAHLFSLFDILRQGFALLKRMIE